MREFHSFDEMNKEDFRALQGISLNILLYFNDFCKQHNLRFYLAGGTLIGAVRHKGFIPWDEDIDVHMPRPDYDRLINLWNNYADTKRYSLCVTDEKHNYRHHAYSICDNNTTLIERRNINDDIAQGIKIDILPFDGVPKSKIRQWIQFFWAIIFAIYNVQRLPENQGGLIMHCAVWGALKLIRKKTRYKIWKYAQKQMSKYDFDESEYVRELVAPLRSMMFIYPRDKFTDAFWVEFEEHQMPAQHYYEEYLERVYKDYMNLPPKDKQHPKGDVVYINLDKSYKEYRGIYYCKNS